MIHFYPVYRTRLLIVVKQKKDLASQKILKMGLVLELSFESFSHCIHF